MNDGEWTAVRVRTTTDRSAVIGALFQVGAESVHEVEDGVITHLKNADRGIVTDILRHADHRATVEYSPAPAVDWTREWRERIGAHRLGNLVVTPPWLADRFTLHERIVIDPGMAFGTGEHETTRGVIRLMQRVIRRGDRVADLGAGSAVLAIGAAKLGASRVVAIEIDPDAIGNAEANITSNEVSDRVAMIEGDAKTLLPLIAPVRVVLANIVSSVIRDLLPTIAAALAAEGRVIVSGMLMDEGEEMEHAFEKGGWKIQDSDREGSWWSATIARP